MLRASALCASLVLSLAALSGCSRPEAPTLTGINKFHDITQVRKGMSANEVTRIMGSHYTPVWEEGIQGVDSGNYIWQYPEGRVYFNLQNVTRVAPSN